MNGNDRQRAAGRELWPLIALWLGLGMYDTEGPPVRRGASFMLTQTVVAVAVGAGLGAAKPLLFGDDIARGWAFGMVVLALPLVAGVARTPPGLAPALGAGIPAGLFAAAMAWGALNAFMTGFWLWFVVLAATVLVAGTVFGRLARDDAGMPDAAGHDG